MNTIESLSNSRDNFYLDKSKKKLEGLERSNSFQRELDNAMGKIDLRSREKKKLMDACVEAESLFVGKMLKEMRKTVDKSDWLHGGYAEEIFEDMLYDEYALQISKNSNLGMAKMLYEELSKKI
jgi:flagellar protein FlgJ